MMTLVAFIVAFGLLVFVHELGHFLAAKYFKVRVDEFAFGFPPKIWAKKYKGVVYKINAIPIGGYVKIFGEDGEESTRDDNFQNKKAWQKIVILAAGVFMNFLLAWILLTGFYMFGGKPLIPGMANYPSVNNTLRVQVKAVTDNTPAATSGIKSGDYIISVDGKEVRSLEEVFGSIQNVSEANGQKTVLVRVSSSGKETDKVVSTYTDKVDSGGKKVEVKRIGITMEETGKVQSDWYMAPIVAFQEMIEITKLTIVGIVDFFKTLLFQFKLSDNVGGPVVIYQLSGVAAAMGPAIFIQFIAVLSISLAIINLVPFPALDGGHILFVIIEKIRDKRIKPKTKDTVIKWGFGLLLLLMAVIALRDFQRIGLWDLLMGVFKR